MRAVKNEFFGGGVSVAGLLTGGDQCAARFSDGVHLQSAHGQGAARPENRTDRLEPVEIDLSCVDAQDDGEDDD